MENPVPIEQNQYSKFLDDVKGRIQDSRIQVAASVNKELIQIYWWIGISQIAFPQAEGDNRSNGLFTRTNPLFCSSGDQITGISDFTAG